MKNHKEMFEALLAGETLINNKGDCLYFNNLELYLDSGASVGKAGSISVKFPEHWKIKQKTININGFDVPEPTRKPLNCNQTYFIPDIDACLREDKGRLIRTWTKHEADFTRLNLGVVHLTEESAILHAKALLSFTRKDND